MKYSMEAEIEASRLEEQVFQSNYTLSEELGRFRFDPDERIMDAGCGTGVLSRFLVENCMVKRVDAVDFSDMRLKQATKLLNSRVEQAICFHQQDLSQLDAKFYNQYDTVICRYVIEHVDSPVGILSQLAKALKVGGRLIVYDLDGVFVNLYTENAKLNAYMETFRKNIRFDLYVGRKLPNYFKQVGLTNISWDAELLCCKGQRLEEERDNTEKRFVAVAPVLSQLMGSVQAFEEFRRLYLEEMMKPENTLVFTKYICTGEKR